MRVVFGIWRSLLIFLLFFVSSIVAAETINFEVEMSPDTITAWEFTDLKIKAIDDNGNIDTSYTDDIFIEVEWLNFNDPDVTLPWGWFGFFETSDQWQKIFSKWLTIKKAWTYTINVVDALVDVTGIKGSATLTVNQEWSSPDMWTLTVSAPTSGAIVTENKINVIATTSLPNTPIVLYLDEEKVQEWLSDQNGDINMSISGIEKWPHTLVLNAVDLGGTIVASSDEIPFVYEADHGSLFVGLELLPSNTVIEWEKITAKITTAEVVDSVTIKIGDGASLPTSKVSDGVFQKELLMEAAWGYPVDLWLSVEGSVTTMEDVDMITVNKDIQRIITLTSEPDIANDKAKLTRTFTGNVEYFKLQYGMDKNTLDLSLTTTVPNANILISNPSVARYAQVTPIDKEWNITWEASEILTIAALRDPICGNRVIETGEECDDGNTNNSDGCSSVCKIETAICGNRRIELWEECDDGNVTPSDGCSEICKIESAICGNGQLELWEECDDGNVQDWDTCSASCKISSAECDTWGIVISTKIEWWKYYLTWSPVTSAQKYLVYRQESRPGALSEMRLVWETNDPMFEYPFDPNANSDQYAWYAVEAVCDHSSAAQLWDFTKVKVWPEETILMILLTILLLRGMRKMSSSSIDRQY